MDCTALGFRQVLDASWYNWTTWDVPFCTSAYVQFSFVFPVYFQPVVILSMYFLSEYLIYSEASETSLLLSMDQRYIVKTRNKRSIAVGPSILFKPLAFLTSLGLCFVAPTFLLGILSILVTWKSPITLLYSFAPSSFFGAPSLPEKAAFWFSRMSRQSIWTFERRFLISIERVTLWWISSCLSFINKLLLAVTTA